MYGGLIPVQSPWLSWRKKESYNQGFAPDKLLLWLHVLQQLAAAGAQTLRARISIKSINSENATNRYSSIDADGGEAAAGNEGGGPARCGDPICIEGHGILSDEWISQQERNEAVSRF